MISRWREIAKRVPPLYWSVGLARYVKFRIELAAENRRYDESACAELPPPLLRHRVHGALDSAVYRNAGQVLANGVVGAAQRHSIDSAAVVLDFACGPGRVATEVKKRVPTWTLLGSDIDGEAIGWAQEHLAHVGRFSVNGLEPPMKFDDCSFDFIYTISLFTHLNEHAQFAWLRELRRVLRPGALLLASVHGALTHGSCTRDELDRLRESGFAYRMDRTGRFKLDGLYDSYQTTFHNRAYVEGKWTQGLEIVEYSEGAIAGHQDLVILKRRD